jgi:flavin reductase (DIM6/NTAB) family NADH-FMN oxidoreductase RutF
MVSEQISRHFGSVDMNWSASQFPGLDRYFRANLLNSATGFKSISLLGSKSLDGITNLAVFSQIIHLGADPALIGILFRPQVAGMHSLKNIREANIFTLNHIVEGEDLKAHWTAARWENSEFEAVGFEEEFVEGISAPFVKGSRVRMALRPEQELPIAMNGTTLLISSVQYLEVPDSSLLEDGFIDLGKAGSLAGSGLDGYVKTTGLMRYSYAKPEIKPNLI